MRGRLGGIVVFALAACAAPESPAGEAATSATSAASAEVATAAARAVTPTATAASAATRTTAAAPVTVAPTVRTASPTVAAVTSRSPTTAPTQAATTGGIGGQVFWGTTPISGLRLEVKPGGLFESGPRTVAATVASDAQGRFRAAGLAPGAYTIFADRTGTPYIANEIPTVDVSAGVDATTTIYLSKALALLTPPHEATVGVSATFTWEQIPGATRYELYLIETGTTCTVPFFSSAANTTIATTNTATVTVAAGKHYAWTAKARDERSDLALYVGTPRCVFVR